MMDNGDGYGGNNGSMPSDMRRLLAAVNKLNCRVPENQFFVEKLKSLMKALAKRKTKFMGKTLAFAAQSIAAHDTELVTEKDMLAVRNVGQQIASILKKAKDNASGGGGGGDEDLRVGGTMISTERVMEGASDFRNLKRKREERMTKNKRNVSRMMLEALFDDQAPSLKFVEWRTKVNAKFNLDLQEKSMTEKIKDLEEDSLITKKRVNGQGVIYGLQKRGFELVCKLRGIEAVSSTSNPTHGPHIIKASSSSSSRGCSSSSSTVSQCIIPPTYSSSSSMSTAEMASPPKLSCTPRMIRSQTGVASPINTQGWNLILLVDDREKVTNDNRAFFTSKLLQNGIYAETRQLPIGDLLWIFKNEATGEEVVSDYIIERKQANDLAASIVDGRYKEQKFRLRNCGLRNVIYLFEGRLMAKQVLTAQHLETALLDTQLCDGLIVQRTNNAEETVQFLTRMHGLIKSVTTHAPPGKWKGPSKRPEYEYKEFCEANKKIKLATVGDIFCAQLKQIKGMSSAKAACIAKLYPTPQHLLSCYEKEMASNTEEEKRLRFTSIIPPGHRSGIGKSISGKVFDVFCSE